MKRISILLLILWGGSLFAQDIRRQQSIDSAAVKYLQTADRQSALYYGNDQDWVMRTTNHPYLEDVLYAKARLSYYNVLYPEVLLRLDLSKDELITLSPEFRHVVLFPENVDFVELHGKHIIYFRSDSLSGSPSSGYYMLLHSGNCKVLKRTTATLMSESEGTRMKYYYSFTTRYYLYKDDVYYIIRNQRGLLKALSPHKKELKRFISANRLQFRLYTDIFLTRTVNEYEKITGSL
jgi:hypothetical protein